MMKPVGAINRRSFLKLIILAAGGSFFYLWASITGRNRALTAKSSIIRLNTGDLGDGTYFYENFILSLNGKNAHFYSNKCTHAGCRINQERGGELVCPCHGSKFEPETGRVLRGPATLPLKALPHWAGPKTGEIMVKV